MTAKRIHILARNILLPVVVCGGLLANTVASALDLSDIERQGKQIYLQGTSPSGAPITAFLGAGQIELPASAAPCGSCHGVDGRGRPEGGVVPPNITWSELSKAYGHEHAFGRRHPAFDDASLAVSILGGTDPAGNKLDQSMPRYAMQREDIDALIAYIQRLEDDFGPGVAAHKVTVGTLLPLSGPAASQGWAIRKLLTTFFQEINSSGGVNGRNIELEVISLGTTPAETAGNVRRALQSSSLFVLVAAYLPATDVELTAMLAESGIPVIGPITRTPDEREQRLGLAFYLYSGTPELIQSLARFSRVAQAAGPDRQLVVGPDADLLHDAAGKLAVDGSGPIETLPYAASGFDAAATAAQLHDGDDVFFLGDADELHELLVALAVEKAWPRVFLPAAIATAQLLQAPIGFDERLFVAYPTQPGDVTADGRALFASLAAQQKLSTAHMASQVGALAAAKILIEAMQRSGHGLNRERLLLNLESMNAYVTGLTPAITFSLNRRIGARGAHIARVDLKAAQIVPAAPWSDLP